MEPSDSKQQQQQHYTADLPPRVPPATPFEFPVVAPPHKPHLEPVTVHRSERISQDSGHGSVPATPDSLAGAAPTP